jgi:hypothetical protein
VARRSLYASMTLPPMANFIVDIKFSKKKVKFRDTMFLRISLYSYTAILSHNQVYSTQLELVFSRFRSKIQLYTSTVALIDFANNSLPVKVHLKKKSGGRKTRL